MQLIALFLAYSKILPTFAVVIVITIKTSNYAKFIH
nr:MAG TPA: hypothetical protein [Caudoviricetes sp.]